MDWLRKAEGWRVALGSVDWEGHNGDAGIASARRVDLSRAFDLTCLGKKGSFGHRTMVVRGKGRVRNSAGKEVRKSLPRFRGTSADADGGFS